MISRLDRRSAVTVIGAAAVGLLAWPSMMIPVSTGLDPSFIAGLHMAGMRGLDVGVEIVSTYGPLGFLSFPEPVYGFTSALALFHLAAIHFAVVGVLVYRSAAVLPLWAALGISYVAAQAIGWLGVPEMALALCAIVAIVAIERAAAGLAIPDWALGLAAFAVAVSWLGKLNTGVVILAVAILTVATVGSRRQLLVFIGLLAAFSAGLWFAAGQGVANVPSFISTSAAMIAGFNSAMGLDSDPAAYWLVAAAAVVTAALAYARFELVTAWPPRHRLVVAVVLALVLFITFKASFVRWHFTFIFATLVILSVATLTPRVSRRTGLLVVACALVGFLGATKLDAWSLLEPTPGHAFAQRLTVRLNSQLADQSRQTLARLYGVDASILGRLSGESVHIGPLETGIALAHPDIDWTPLPTYQDYAVYTSGLDDVNRERLMAPDAAPRFILRSVPMAIDGRFPWFEGPATMRAMLCLYDEVDVAGPWQLLERGADRCAEPRLLSTVTTEPGGVVPVPRLEEGSSMLFVRIKGLEPTIAEAALAFAFKAHEWYITRNETDRYRLVAPTAAQGLVMDVGPALAYSEGFGVGPAWRSIMVAPGPRSSVATTRVELEFWTVGSASD